MWFLSVGPRICPAVDLQPPQSGFLQIPPHDGHPCLRLTVPATESVVDFHHQVVAHAGRTRKAPGFEKKPGAILARSTEKDIAGFLGKSACDKAFSDFFIFFLPSTIVVGGISCPFHCERKRYHLNSSKEILWLDRSSGPSK